MLSMQEWHVTKRRTFRYSLPERPAPWSAPAPLRHNRDAISWRGGVLVAKHTVVFRMENLVEDSMRTVSAFLGVILLLFLCFTHLKGSYLAAGGSETRRLRKAVCIHRRCPESLVSLVSSPPPLLTLKTTFFTRPYCSRLSEDN